MSQALVGSRSHSRGKSAISRLSVTGGLGLGGKPEAQQAGGQILFQGQMHGGRGALVHLQKMDAA